jgi:hypothetical protein
LAQFFGRGGKIQPVSVPACLLHKTLVKEDDGSSRHLQCGQEHRPLFIEMCDELVAVMFDFRDQRGELVGL